MLKLHKSWSTSRSEFSGVSKRNKYSLIIIVWLEKLFLKALKNVQLIIKYKHTI